MGTRRARQRQEQLWVTHTELVSGPGHPFYKCLNQLLDSEKFDEFCEAECAQFYAENNGRPSLTPGTYFRLMLVGYFEESIPNVALRGGWPIRWACGSTSDTGWTNRHRIIRPFRAPDG